MLTVMGVLNGCLGALAGPSSSAMTRQTVAEADLPRAVAGRRLSQNAAMVLGFSLAGVLVAALGSGWAIAIDAATFAVAALCFGLIRVPGLPAPTGARPRCSATCGPGRPRSSGTPGCGC